MNTENRDYPDLALNEDELKKIYDVIQCISCLDIDTINKVERQGKVLEAAIKICDCAMAFWHGDPGDDLSKLDELIEAFDEVNHCASDFNDALDSLEGSLQ